MKVSLRAALSIFVMAHVMVPAGCSTPSDQPQLAPVTGVITLDDQPVATKQIVFSPDAGGRASMAISDEQGYYELRYTARIHGAMLGTHRVTISTPRDEYQTDWTESIPRQYNVESILTAQVEDRKNEINFELTSQSDPGKEVSDGSEE